MSKDLFDDLFDNVLEYRLMSLILRNVVYQEEGTTIEGVHVKRGQWIRSYRKLAEDLKYKEGRGYKQYSHQAIQKALKRLEQRGYIKIRAIQLTDKLTGKLTERLTLIEVVKDQENQGFNQDGESERLTHQLTEQLTDQGTKIKKDKEIKEKEPLSPETNGRKNLSNDADVESFVEILSDSNPFDRVPKKLIIKYINAIRFRRKTKRIAASIVAGLWEEWKKFDQDVVTFALWTHIEKYSKDKDENYTLGIMRNTNVHEARRQLMVLKNRNQSGQQTKPRPYWEEQKRREEEIERKRLEQRDRQIKVQQFIDAGFHPMNDADLLADWLEGRVSLADLKERKWGS
ncbi:hypothetical protein [Thermoactinomyces sp. CICC 10521]|uniref:hypothetical protein n=1 Tax=Thermoactinomyces sp. CICC 10521 TaxID=2767426 RepID=UPI0018DDA130|nr:hypothetical protein [Thermoactinomyces sp. CICC 10521]MBH8609130.1 hypothetical protein [Thermoactinomyces sp. CICC 10521]